MGVLSFLLCVQAEGNQKEETTNDRTEIIVVLQLYLL